MTGVTRYQLGRAKIVLQLSSRYLQLTLGLSKASKPARTLKAATKNAMRLGTAQSCYTGSMIGWVSALQVGVVVHCFIICEFDQDIWLFFLFPKRQS